MRDRQRGTTASNHETVEVKLGQGGYEILIGSNLLKEAAGFVQPCLRQNRVFVITDENVAKYHLERFQKSFDGRGIKVNSFILPAGEGTKCFAQMEKVIDWLLKLSIDRKSLILAFGGGVIGDLAGFVAASVMRGVDFVQIPTSLLAQVDSSVGGKTGINTARGKNLVGAFHQPRLVLADTSVLSTLPEREMRAGYAEVVKYGLIRDRAFFDWLEVKAEGLFSGDQDCLRYAIRRSCEIKAEIVSQDERENGVRALLNLGHTFGHAFEAEAGYNGTLLHGEAVAVGMRQAFDFAVERGICQEKDAALVKAHLARLRLPTEANHVASRGNAERLLDHMGRDKKRSDGQLAFILPRKIGEAYLDKSISHNTIRDFLVRETES